MCFTLGRFGTVHSASENIETCVHPPRFMWPVGVLDHFLRMKISELACGMFYFTNVAHHFSAVYERRSQGSQTYEP